MFGQYLSTSIASLEDFFPENLTDTQAICFDAGRVSDRKGLEGTWSPMSPRGNKRV